MATTPRKAPAATSDEAPVVSPQRQAQADLQAKIRTARLTYTETVATAKATRDRAIASAYREFEDAAAGLDA